jgi:lysylphosphatidylglycerol synthetase-like protein (DUF2156 family)
VVGYIAPLGHFGVGLVLVGIALGTASVTWKHGLGRLVVLCSVWLLAGLLLARSIWVSNHSDQFLAGLGEAFLAVGFFLLGFLMLLILTCVDAWRARSRPSPPDARG